MYSREFAARLMAAKVTFDDVQDLYRKYGAALVAYGISVLGDRSSAEDVLHEVFLKLLDAPRIDEPKPYLFKAVRNRALSSRRRLAAAEPLDAQEWLVKPEGMIEAGIEVERALRELPLEQREVVVMRVWGEMTFEETARVLDVSVNTVASRYRYAIEKIRARLTANLREQR
jgi:RNA polymerase sigma-70 factor (ECF subfamily)